MNPKLVKAALAAGIVGAVLVFVMRAQQLSSPPPKPIATAPLLQALAAAKQPAAAAESVKQAAAQGEICHYAEVATRAALDADLHGLVPGILDTAPRDCPRWAIMMGERAEALARAGSTDEGERTAQSALKPKPANSYAELALARVAFDKNQMTACAEHAEKALKYGRGAEAERLLGRSTLARGLFKEAEAHYQNVLRANPSDVEAAFSAGVCNDKLGRYHQAREAFLQTLNIDPKHEEARKYLVVLTYKAGAKDEARHHLQKLAEILPKDSPTLLELEHLLSGSNAGADAGASAGAAGSPAKVK